MIRVYISPTYTGRDQADGGIRRVVEAQVRYLPQFGVEVVDHPAAADLLAIHGTMIPERDDVPIVNHNHGLYWREYEWPLWADGANRAVIDRLLRADAVTAPSRWVANAIRRGTLLDPEVVHHGVDTDAWTPGESQGYVLWNKARVDAVSDPSAVVELAVRCPELPFVTTGGALMTNVHVTGPVPLEQMRTLVGHAGVYLATVRETFGIGTLEALACGVPVVGWDFGGQVEIVTPETGILVPFGDYDALAAAVRRAMAERASFSAAARADAIARWQWPARIQQYADLYRRVLMAERADRPRTSVVITSYNLNRFLPEAYASAVEQADEVIVVDDCGTEGAKDVLPPDARVVRPPENLGLSGARNFGAALATGKYLLFLDADDMLPQGALSVLADALDHNRSLHIAYGPLDVINESGGGRKRNPWPQDFDWRGQIAHLNQLHYAAMWRRDAFVRSGGYRTRHWRAEDASLWTRVTSYGLRAARVTDVPTLLYRMRDGSKSREEGRQYADKDGDWTAEFPFRVGDGTGAGGADARARGDRPHPWRVPFGAPGGGTRKAWPVPHHQSPAVSIVIPVGPGHARYLVDALDSLQAQDIDAWEAIVVNDTGERLDLPGHRWARVLDVSRIDGDRVLRMGAGAARNWGVDHALSPLVLFLDADDMLAPGALRALLTRYAEGDATFVYGDCLVAKTHLDQPIETLRAAEFSAQHWLMRAARQEGLGLPAVTMLIATEDAPTFDEELPAWEDGDAYLQLCARGATGARVDVPVLTYRILSGQRREIGEKDVTRLRRLFAKRYTETIAMAKRTCCGGNAPAILAARDVLVEPPLPPIEVDVVAAAGGEIRMAYIGDLVGEHTVFGRPSGRVYRVGNNPFNKFFSADARDVADLLNRTDFEVVQR